MKNLMFRFEKHNCTMVPWLMAATLAVQPAMVHAATLTCAINALDTASYEQGITRIDAGISAIKKRMKAQPGHRRTYMLVMLEDSQRLQGSLKVANTLLQIRQRMSVPADVEVIDDELRRQILPPLQRELAHQGQAALTILENEDDAVLKRQLTGLLVTWNNLGKPLAGCAGY